MLHLLVEHLIFVITSYSIHYTKLYDGINVEKTKKLLLIICSIATAACVSVSGVIGFVGIAVPHIIRLMVGADHRVLLPYSVITSYSIHYTKLYEC